MEDLIQEITNWEDYDDDLSTQIKQDRLPASTSLRMHLKPDILGKSSSAYFCFLTENSVLVTQND